MGFWDTVKGYGETALNVGTLGGYGTIKDIYSSSSPAQAQQQAPVYYGGDAAATQRYRDQLARQDREASGEAARYRGMADQSRGMQRDVYGGFGEMGSRYDAMYRGEGPSLGREMLQQGMSQAQQQAGQTAASTTGGAANALVAQRLAQQTGASLAGQAAGQAAQMRQQEQFAAMQGKAAMLQAQGGLAGQMREGDYYGAGQMEGRAGQRLGAQMGMEGQIYQGQLGQAGADQQAQMWAQGANIESEEARKARKQQFVSGLYQGAGKAAGMGA